MRSPEEQQRHQDVQTTIEDLAINGIPREEIHGILERKGMSGVIPHHEVEVIAVRAKESHWHRTHLKAKEIIVKLASAGKTNSSIHKKLKEEGLDGVILAPEVELIANEAAMHRSMPSGIPKYKLIRFTGALAILAGLVILYFIGVTRLTVLMIIFGLVLLIFPDWSDTEID